MPDGSAYVGHPWQDAILQAQPGGVHGGPTTGAAHDIGQATTEGMKAVLQAPDTLGKYLGDKVMEHTNSPLAATIARILPNAAAMLIPGAGEARIAEAAPGEVAAADRALSAGFRTPQTHPIAQGLAGSSGQDALTLHNATVADTIARNTAGIEGDSSIPLTHEGYIAGRADANAVYNRTANAVPTAPLPQPVLDAINTADVPAGGRITKGSPDAATKIQAIKDQFAGAGPVSGDNLINETRGLRQEGSAGVGSDDPSAQELGRYQLGVAKILEDHIGASLPANGDVSLSQFQLARQQLAQSHVLENVTKGGRIDMQALNRVDQQNPGLLTGGPKVMADFAGANRSITGNPSNIYMPPSYTADVSTTGHNALSLLSPSAYAAAGGAKVAARRVLTGGTEESVAMANRAFPPPDPNLFAPLDTTGRPPGPISPLRGPVAFGPTGEPLHGIEPTAPPAAGTQATIPLPENGPLPFGPPMGDQFAGPPAGRLGPAPAPGGETPIALRQAQNAASTRAAPPPGPGQLPLLPPEMPHPIGAQTPPSEAPATGGEFPNATEQMGNQLALAPSAPRGAPSAVGEGAAGPQPLPPDLAHGVPSHLSPTGARITPNGESPFPDRNVLPGSTVITRHGNGADQPATSYIALTPFDDGTLRGTSAYVHPDSRGVEGFGGKQNILDAAQHAQDVNMPFNSDTTLTAAQAGAHDSLMKSGQTSAKFQSPEIKSQFDKVVAARKGVVNGNGQPVLQNITLPGSTAAPPLGTALGG